jgi:hypothetical protein
MEGPSAIIEKKRRGPRKTKILDNKEITKDTIPSESFSSESINVNSNNTFSVINESDLLQTNYNQCDNVIINTNVNHEDLLKVPKKRGRKPKGGKIVSQHNENNDNSLQTMPNIILHLKCKMSDLEKYNSSLLDNNLNNNNNINNFLSDIKNDDDVDSDNNETDATEIQGLDTYEQFGKMNKNSDLGYLIIDAPNKLGQNEYIYSTTQNNKLIPSSNSNSNCNCNCDKSSNIQSHDMNSVWKKLKDLEVQLHKNDISDKRSACFWDTCEFDTPPVYIPRVQLDNSYHVYGCFCSPECAVAFLLKENIDAATRFERLHLLNHMYGKICNYERSIKPAPDPFYTLDKYYGNLSIQEFRKLLKSERLLLVVDLPLTRELPEIHLDNGDYLIGGQSIPTTGKYKVKKSNQKNTKANIMQERFGVSK